MAWITTETPNAKYVLIFSVHSGETEPSPTPFDALILETTGVSWNNALGAYNDPQYQKILAQAVRGQKTIWLTDPGLSEKAGRWGKTKAGILGAATALGSNVLIRALMNRKKMTRRQFLSRMAISAGLLSPGLPIALSIIAPGQSHSEEIRHPSLWKKRTQISDIIYGGLTTVRNAITAEKAETRIAPLLRKELGRKPVIAMAWGVGHYGIKELLENPQKRKKILEETRLTDYVTKDYPKAIRFRLDESGNPQEEKEYSFSFYQKPKKDPLKPSSPLSRREFFKKFRPK
ncbi:MAG: hypothetical protein HY917_04545 [Candidatus Diapherotrites archaeon]|nr:hypothetical protein [Candidatus Diapherotrites archaeon]